MCSSISSLLLHLIFTFASIFFFPSRPVGLSCFCFLGCMLPHIIAYVNTYFTVLCFAQISRTVLVQLDYACTRLFSSVFVWRCTIRFKRGLCLGMQLYHAVCYRSLCGIVARPALIYADSMYTRVMYGRAFAVDPVLIALYLIYSGVAIVQHGRACTIDALHDGLLHVASAQDLI